MRFARALAVQGAVALAIVAAAPAMDLQRVLTGYSVTSWTERDGVSIGPVRAIVQDPDGYLWLGTASSLLRFDGVRFTTHAALGWELPQAPILALLEQPDGALWVGYGERAGVRVVRHDRIEPVRADAPRATVSALAGDRSGVVWAATDNGLFRYHDRWQRVPIEAAPQSAVLTVYVDHRGELFVGTSAGLFARTSSGTFNRVDDSIDAVRSIDEDAESRLWASNPRTGGRPVGGGGSWHAAEINAIGVKVFHDSLRNLWIGTRGQGLWRMRHDRAGMSTPENATVETGLVSNGIWDVIEDREGNIWLGTQHGLSRLTPHIVTPVTDLGLVHAISPGPGGAVLVGTAGGVLTLSGAAGDNLGQRRVRMKGADVHALYVDTASAIWVATEDGVERIVGGRVVPVPGPAGSSLRDVRSIVGDGARGVWIADRTAGLFHHDGSGIRRVSLPSDLTAESIAFLYADHAGRLWVAFQRGRLATIERAGVTRIARPEDGYAAATHAALYAIAEDEAGTIWIGGTGGVTRYAGGRFSTFTQASGLPGRRVTAVISDLEGSLWLGVDSVLARVDREQLTRASASRETRLDYTILDQSRGLAGVPIITDNQAAVRTTDGQLWFVTGRGVTVIDPAALSRRPPRQPVVARIEGAIVDDARVAPLAGGVIDAGATRLRVDYTAVQLTAPTQLRFRYRLEGFDADWIDAGTKRQAYYMNLPPRPYRFRVQAGTSDGRWTGAESRWEFVIAPSFYQTGWFRVLATAALASAVWALWWMRVRRMRHEFTIVLAERARLSREIHDTLLQNLAGVAIQCVGISNTLHAESPARAQLDTVRRQVEEYVREIRQSVWDLRTPMLEKQDLAAALRDMGARATAGTDIRFDVVVRGKARRLRPRVENEIFRVAQEALTNAVRHSGAARVRVEIAFGRREVALRVVDDGCGFDVAYQRSTHGPQIGLTSMKERAAELGGRLHIATRPAGGTEVELVVATSAGPAGI